MTEPYVPLPPSLAARPRDLRRGVPIPFVSEHERNGQTVVDFVGVNVERAMRCADEQLCSLCGWPLGYWIAFLGGPQSAARRQYTDPPMHEDCALAAIRICPHIAIRHHQRAPEHRTADRTWIPPGWVEDKPDRWVLGITRSFEYGLYYGSVVFQPAPFKRTHTFRYDKNGILTEERSNK
jgi:hypothetical protein